MDIKIEENEVIGAVKTTISDKSVEKVGKLEIKKTKADKITTKIGDNTLNPPETDTIWTKTNVIVAIIVGIFTIIGIILKIL